MKTRTYGFTLAELLFCLAGLGVLGAVAVPGLQAGRHAASSADAKSALLETLMKSSHKAALHGSRTTLCPSFNGEQCSAGFDWSRGWIAFIDRNGSRERELDEAVIMVKPALDGARLLSTSGRSRIVFQGNGGNAGSNVTFTLCDGRGAGKAQTLVVSNTGNLRQGVASPEQIAAACTF